MQDSGSAMTSPSEYPSLAMIVPVGGNSGTVADGSGFEVPRVAIADSDLSCHSEFSHNSYQVSTVTVYVRVSGFCVYKYGLP